MIEYATFGQFSQAATDAAVADLVEVSENPDDVKIYPV